MTEFSALIAWLVTLLGLDTGEANMASTSPMEQPMMVATIAMFRVTSHSSHTPNT